MTPGSVLLYDEVAALPKIVVDRDLVVISVKCTKKWFMTGRSTTASQRFLECVNAPWLSTLFRRRYAVTGLRIGSVYGPKNLVSRL